MINIKFPLAIFLLFCCCLNGLAQQKFIIQTDQVKQLQLRKADSDSIYSIPEYRKSSGGFLIECADPKKLFIVNQSSTTPINFQLLWLNENYSTTPIAMKRNQEMSIQTCFDDHSENYLWTSVKSVFEQISSFFNTSRFGVVTTGSNAYLQAPKDLNFEFKAINPTFLTPNSFEIDWTTSEKICQLSIVDEATQELVFKKKKPKGTKLVFADLSSEAKEKLRAGNSYKIIVKLKKKRGNQKVYDLGFYVLSEEELGVFREFLE